MISKADLAAVNEFMNAEASVGTNLTPDLAGGASRTSPHAEPGASKLPAPGAPTGAEISFEQRLLLEMAAQSFDQAAHFARACLPADARLWARRANEQLDQAAALARPQTPKPTTQALIEV